MHSAAKHEPEQPRRNLMLFLAAIVVLLAMLLSTWIVIQQQSRPQIAFNRPHKNAPEDPPSRNIPVKQPTNVATNPPPIEETPPQPDPSPVKPPPIEETPLSIKLPALTRFRRLVLEADQALELQGMAKGRRDSDREDLRVVDATLQAIDSAYATYSGRLLERELTDTEKQELAAGIANDFLTPDVDSKSFRLEKSQRIQLWLHEGARLPDSKALPTVGFKPRRQETVSCHMLERVLTAIEQEFGQSEIGRKPNELPVDMVILVDVKTFREFGDKRLGIDVPEWSEGYYSPKWDLVAAPVRDKVVLAEVLRHELFHAYQAHVALESIRCPWFSEGTAEWLDKTAAEGGRLATDEGFRESACGYLLALIEHGLKVELARFLALDQREFYADPRLNYLKAYCFVDFLRHTPDLRDDYFMFFRALKDGKSVDEAMKLTLLRQNMQRLEQRFIEYLRGFKKTYQPPHFSHDIPPGGSAADAADPRGDGAPKNLENGWGEVLLRLADIGIVWQGPAPIVEKFDRLVMLVDSSVSMQHPLNSRKVDYEQLLCWLTATKLAPDIKLTRKGLNTPAPPVILALVVQAHLQGKPTAFAKASGIVVDGKLGKLISLTYDDLAGELEPLRGGPAREVCRFVCEVIADVAKVRNDYRLVDFNVKVEAVAADADSPTIKSLFDKTRDNAAPRHLAGADTDWHKAWEKALNPQWHQPARKTLFLFFSDGPNSAGLFGQPVSNRNEDRYRADVKLLAQSVVDSLRDAGLAEDDKSNFLFFALPGAEDQGLEALQAVMPRSGLHVWSEDFATGK